MSEIIPRELQAWLADAFDDFVRLKYFDDENQPRLKKTEKLKHFEKLEEQTWLLEKQYFVYFAQSIVPNSPIKIGTATDLWTRLVNIQMVSPFELKILGIIKGSSKLEKVLHRYFSNFRLHGEWFQEVPVIKEFIQRYTHPWDKSDEYALYFRAASGKGYESSPF